MLLNGWLEYFSIKTHWGHYEPIVKNNHKQWIFVHFMVLTEPTLLKFELLFKKTNKKLASAKKVLKVFNEDLLQNYLIYLFL